MASLLPKLLELLKDEYELREGVKKGVEYLSRDLGITHAALCKVAEELPGDLLGEQVRLWAHNIRELSYDMEDVVDSFLVHPQGSETASITEALEDIMKKMTDLFEKGKTHHQISHAIANVVAHGEGYGVDVVAADPATTINIVDPSCLLDLCKDQKEIVGIEEARDEVVRRLTDGNDDNDVSKKQLKTLALFGFDGLGKTTLAKAVYDCLSVGPLFAWVTTLV
uniref:Uncharacterized protein n=1 Tax=Avena sativa TaxID=4498 RepID=A0ACD6ARJ2_AVESA